MLLTRDNGFAYSIGGLFSFIPSNFLGGLWSNPLVIGILLVGAVAGGLYLRSLIA